MIRANMPQWVENNNAQSDSEDDDTFTGSDNPGKNFIVSFDDPYDPSKKYISKEFIEECCLELEREEVLFRIIFEELLEGSPNRFIADKYKLTVRRVENISKTIHRRILQISKTHDHLISP
jgi:hypothetical protein